MMSELVDQIDEVLWRTGPRGLAPSELVLALREMFAVQVDGEAIIEALDGDRRFAFNGKGFRLDLPDDVWTCLTFGVG